MTAELWIPEPFDDFPYENEPLDSPALISPPWTAGAGESSAPVAPAASAGGPTPAGALTFHCPVCLLDLDEPWCWSCGANLTPTIDRGSQAPVQENLRPAERTKSTT